MKSLQFLLYAGSRGAISKPVTITTSKMGADLKISQQSISRWLIKLEKDELITRKGGIRGCMIGITPKGRKLMEGVRNELDEVLSEGTKMVVRGRVVSGMREGSYYIGLKGYSAKIKERLGFEPYPGTLNVKMGTLDDVRFKEKLGSIKGFDIEGFTEGGRTFGGLKCFHSFVEGFECAVVIPERSHYGMDVLELISPHNLRKKLNAKDGDEVKIEVITD